MKGKILVLGTLFLMVVSWASVALASNVDFWIEAGDIGSNLCGNTRCESWSGPMFAGWFNYTPTKTGAFSQQIVSVEKIYASISSLTPESYDPPGPPYTALLEFRYNSPAYGYFQSADLYLDQTGPLRFTDLTFALKMMNDEVAETTIFTYSADADLIANGGLGDLRNFGENFYIGHVIIPVTMTYHDDWGWDGWYAHGEGYATLETTFTLTMTGHVVPVPSTMLLLCSGLMGLGGWRRLRKG